MNLIISALSWPQWVLLLLVPPAVISLYFLKLKRKPVEVPSTLLWRRALEDLHVNSIWQRLRNNLLLYLQLLFLAFLIISCLRPGWSGTETVGERSIYLLDNSASMQSFDVKPSRLDVAKEKIRELIASSGSDDVGMVIAFSDRADVRQGFTKDKNRLLAALDSIEATNRTTDVAEALRAAAGLANPGRASFGDLNDVQVADALPATVYLLSDGGFGKLDDTSIGQLKIDYIPVGEEVADNVGILSFAVQRNDEKKDRVEAFARIGNFGSTEVNFTASLEVDGKLVDASSIKIAPKSESGLVFELTEVEGGELKLVLDCDDKNQVDNAAYAAIRPSKPINVLVVTGGNPSLETGLKTERCIRIANIQVEGKSFLEGETYLKNEADGLYDLIIFDECSPKKMPSANTLFIGSQPPNDKTLPTTGASTTTDPDRSSDSDAAKSETSPPTDAWQFGEKTGPLMILDVNRSNPITQFLEMNAVVVFEGTTVKPPEGGSVLMSSDSGPIFAVAPRGPYQDAVLGFGVLLHVNTNWGTRRSFPVFVYSVVEYLGGGVTEASAPSVLPGSAIGLTLSNRYDEYTVRSPKGENYSLTRNLDSRFTFTQTEEIGTYKIFVDGSDSAVESFSVNLFSNRESDIDVSTTVSIGAEPIKGNATQIKSRQELWRWLLLAGLALLMFEWVVFNRRIFV